MPLILRVDVDKPYGNSTFIRAVRSKLSEDYWYPNFAPFNVNYLDQLSEFLEHCNREKIAGYFYFRNCTCPNDRVKQLMIEGGHQFGVHAENTRSLETFKEEWNTLEKKANLKFSSFSKHGSGVIKIGKYHYPPYEPDKYLDWSKKLKLDFRFGNDICDTPDDFNGAQVFYPKIFWIERPYRSSQLNSLHDIIKIAKENIVPVLIHPSNYASTEDVKNDFLKIIELAKQEEVEWIL